jgi:hypothetical protein
MKPQIRVKENNKMWCQKSLNSRSKIRNKKVIFVVAFPLYLLYVRSGIDIGLSFGTAFKNLSCVWRITYICHSGLGLHLNISYDLD